MTDVEVNTKVSQQDGEKGKVLDYQHNISNSIIDTKGGKEHSKVPDYQHTRSKRAPIPKIITSEQMSGENTDNKAVTTLHKNDKVKG